MCNDLSNPLDHDPLNVVPSTGEVTGAEDRKAAERAQRAEAAKIAAQVARDERVADAARQRQRDRARGATGASDTILTSPLGDPGAAPAPRRTILGG